MKKSKKLLSLLLTLSILFSPALVTDVKAAPVSLTTQDNFPNYYYFNKEITTDSFITMEVGQKLEVRNLVFVYTNNKEKPLDYLDLKPKAPIPKLLPSKKV